MNRRYVASETYDSSTMYLPTNLIQRRRYPQFDCDEQSLQELDETVAAVTKQSSSTSFGEGENSPTSISYDIGAGSYGRDPLEEKVIQHLTGVAPLDLKQAESVSGGSILSRSSRCSRSSSRASSRASSRSSRRNDRLERRIYQTILTIESEASDFSYSTKECNDSACRTAQFILSDLFHEASESMNDMALPFGFGSHSEATSRSRGAYLSASVPPRHPNGAQGIDQSSVDSRNELKDEPVNISHNKIPHNIDASEEVIMPVIISPEGKPESSSFLFALDDSAEQAKFPTVQRNDTAGSKSDCTGPLAYSIDSQLQYSTTNETSFSSEVESQRVLAEIGPPEQASSPQALSTETTTENWTSFDMSPFENEGITDDDFDFDAFLPFENDVGFTATGDEAEVDPAWDASRIIPTKASPISPACVINFFTDDDAEDADNDDDITMDPKTAALWEGGFQPHQHRVFLDSKASF